MDGAMDGAMNGTLHGESTALEANTLRRALDLVATGVTVVAAELEPECYVVSVNSVRALALDPPLVMLCPRKASRLGAIFSTVECFTVNVLRDDQRDLARLFSGVWRGRSPPPFRFTRHETGPPLDGAFVSLGCTPRRAVDLGAHLMITARVVRAQGGDSGMPLLRRDYRAGRDVRELLGALRAI
jgi:flavin reductase (DIM6/NTAB) family NADH-FMN oxidoreductase RutF